MLIGSNREAQAAWNLSPGPKPANKSYSIKDYEIKEALSSSTPLVLSLFCLGYSLSPITDPYCFEKPLAKEAVWSTVMWMLTVLNI